MNTCEVVFGRLTAAEIETVNTCASCAGTGERQSHGTAVPCQPCRMSGRTVQAGYAYITTEPVQVGDVVRTPASDWNPASEGTVVRLGTEYGGSMRPLSGIAVRAADRAAELAGDGGQPAAQGDGGETP